MYKIHPLKKIKRDILVPPDKSISHRAVIISSLCAEKTIIKPFLSSEDTLATVGCMRNLGVGIQTNEDGSLLVRGEGRYFPKKRKVVLSAHESGTTMRILSGVLCAQKFPVDFTAGPSLKKRPMGRIVWPLQQMGACFKNKREPVKVGSGWNVYPPLHLEPCRRLTGGRFDLEIASAQVKSAIMLAALYADGETTITEPYQSRDHTERMLSLFKANIRVAGRFIKCKSTARLVSPQHLFIPADFSSASFFIVLGLLLENSRLLIKNVNVNPTRCGLLRILKRMGAKIRIRKKKNYCEPYADILVESSCLSATQVSRSEVPLLIDEIPILCVAATFAEGRTDIWGVRELKVKETDRVASIVSNLGAAGVSIKDYQCSGRSSSTNDWMISIEGGGKRNSTRFRSFGDHRTAMSLIIFAMASEEAFSIDDIACINKSFPGFITTIKSLYK